jgi:hypothetical protein
MVLVIRRNMQFNSKDMRILESIRLDSSVYSAGLRKKAVQAGEFVRQHTFTVHPYKGGDEEK